MALLIRFWSGSIGRQFVRIRFAHFPVADLCKLELTLQPFARAVCAISSGVEHHLDMVGVAGSNPASRTIFISQIPGR